MDWQGLLVYMVIGAASALIARRVYERWKNRNSHGTCGPGCGCSGK